MAVISTRQVPNPPEPAAPFEPVLTVDPPGAINTTRVAPGALTLIEHGSKQWAAVTEKVNDFVEELEAAVVGGGAGAVVVGGELDDGLPVTGSAGELVAGGAVDEGVAAGGADVVLVDGGVVLDVGVDVDGATVGVTVVVRAGTLVSSGTLTAMAVVGATTVVSVVTLSVENVRCAASSSRSEVRGHATAATLAAATAATATNTRTRRTRRGARGSPHVGAISRARSASGRRASSTRAGASDR